MNVSEELKEAFGRLNPRQREAVEHTDGPLLVVAGPGTGKTQILSARAANILLNCDASPQNILCLTYTDAGAEAMRRRLIKLIGREAYGIEVSTFHGFASSMRAQYPQYFVRPLTDELITGLKQRELLDTLLKTLPYGHALASQRDGIANHINVIASFIEKVKRAGASYEELEAIAEQNIATVEWLENNTKICEIVSTKANPDIVCQFGEEVKEAYLKAPSELKESCVSTPGIYVPFIVAFAELVDRTELIDESGKTTGFGALRDQLFTGTQAEGKHFKISGMSKERFLEACKLVRSYQEELTKGGLYDYNDMIADFVDAVSQNAEFKQVLQDRFTYIQVDEFQDTNGAQMNIITQLCEGIEKPNIMAVGDDDQAIMRFQGATIECINQFIDKFVPHITVLETNYRSTPEIIDFGMKVASQIERRLVDSDKKIIKAFNASNEQTSFSENVYDSAAEQYRALAKSIRERLDSGYLESCEEPDTAIAVIAAKHSVLSGLTPYLIAEDIPFNYRAKNNLLTTESAQSLLAIIRCVSALSQGREKLAQSYLPQIVAAPEWDANHASSVEFALYVKREHKGDWLGGMRATSDKRIQALYNDLMRWADAAPSSPVRTLLFEIAERPLAYYRSHADEQPFASAEFNAAIRALLNFIEGEINAAYDLKRALRLPDVVERLEAAQKYGASIEVSVSLGAPNAVCLTTAHSSKGLEYDCVYLADADDTTWHKSNSGIQLYPSNVLFGDERDEDDTRRLVFVALTRAKRHLEIYRSGGETLRELEALIDTEFIESTPEELDEAILTEWRQSYALDTPELAALVDVRKDVKHLSASALNNFVSYEEGCPNSELFPQTQVMRLPDAPKIFFEFGSIVHHLMETISKQVMRKPALMSLEDAIEAHRKQVARLDYAETDVVQYTQRYERIIEKFVPWFIENVASYERREETKISSETQGHTPLFGYLDLMLITPCDESSAQTGNGAAETQATKTIQIVDFKTGKADKVDKVDINYERQLRFYKLMVERSEEFKGCSVISMGDYYVEPSIETGELFEPYAVSATEEEIAHLEQLIDAVWARIQAGKWDTSAFEESELFAAAQQKQAGAKTKAAKQAVMQQAYEDWLIQDYLASCE